MSAVRRPRNQKTQKAPEDLEIIDLDAPNFLRPGRSYERDVGPPAKHRLRLAMQLLYLIYAVVIGTGLAVVFAPVDRLDLIERLLGVVFGPLITLLGTTFTWYYASIRTDHRDDRH